MFFFLGFVMLFVRSDEKQLWETADSPQRVINDVSVFANSEPYSYQIATHYYKVHKK